MYMCNYHACMYRYMYMYMYMYMYITVTSDLLAHLEGVWVKDGIVDHTSVLLGWSKREQTEPHIHVHVWKDWEFSHCSKILPNYIIRD